MKEKKTKINQTKKARNERMENKLNKLSKCKLEQRNFVIKKINTSSF